jgi:hypothetical protein
MPDPSRFDENRSPVPSVKYRSVQAQAHLTVVQARAGLVRGETTRINTARGLTKSHRERLRDSYPQDLNPKPEFPERLGTEPRTASGAGTSADRNRIAQRTFSRNPTIQPTDRPPSACSPE